MAPPRLGGIAKHTPRCPSTIEQRHGARGQPDVHDAQAIRYSPATAAFGDFDPFWEFVAGPINAGTFGPNPLDGTFGPEVKFTGIPADLKQNRPPSDGFQFFGQADIDGTSGALTVALKNLEGKMLFSQTLTPEG